MDILKSKFSRVFKNREIKYLGLSSLDPFLEIDPSWHSYDINTQGNSRAILNEFLDDAKIKLSDSNSEWEFDLDGNAFSLCE